MKYLIRNERDSDFRSVEELIRLSFWNLYSPGCSEHYLAHEMRSHQDFIQELDLVMELNGKVMGSIMYTSAHLDGENGARKDILTFGPVCIHPDYQRQGYGKKLIEHSFGLATSLGYDVVAIFGNPGNYVSLGFKSCLRYKISVPGGFFPTAFLIRQLKPGALENSAWVYHDSEVYHFDEAKAEEFDKGFQEMKRETLPRQEEFFILSSSRIQISDI